MEHLRHISLAELGRLFEKATAEAAREALAHGLPLTGTNEAAWHCRMCGKDVTEPCGLNCPHDSR